MGPETTFAIGMEHIKERRLTKRLYSYPDLTVGQCVPFYFCPRSVMLYTLHQQDHKDLSYREGQTWIIHLEADMNGAITWATQQKNAGFSLHRMLDRTFLMITQIWRIYTKLIGRL
jgi:hypothetical protein